MYLSVFIHNQCLFKQHILSIFFFHTATVDVLINEYKSTVWNPHIPAMHYLGMNVHLENEQRPACLVKPANKRFYGYLGVLYTKRDVRLMWGILNPLH